MGLYFFGDIRSVLQDKELAPALAGGPGKPGFGSFVSRNGFYLLSKLHRF